ncbi:MAG: FAD-dependent oxidoreductase [Desulfobulbaceae bacterium]|jgi:heterodisulfide reductase subunit A|nr:FAD-dependent oxidoreductase [Desulfobulbaceae bacterium]
MQNKTKLQSNGTVLVVGGGLGGIRAALDLAEARKDVILVDKAPCIGGLMAQLDRTFPTNNCDLCTVAPFTAKEGRGGHLDMRGLTTVTAVSGKEGNFTASLMTAPRFINVEKCTACGECLRQFPQCVSFAPGLDPRAPTCMRYPKATPYAYVIDMAKCGDKEALRKCCPVGAIEPDALPKAEQVQCGSIIMAAGADLFDPSHLDYFGYAAQPDVVTSLEYERMLSASGPTGGKLLRPSNGQPPKRVAWIQCVGSRGLQKGAASYCSSACCMFALKEAIVTRERFDQGIETTIFYMDMRTFGKDYEKYLTRAKEQYGVRLVHARPHDVLRPEGVDKLQVIYTLDEAPKHITEEFDMVVLSTGFKMNADVKKLAEDLGVELYADGFPKTDCFNAVATSVPGVYVCGTIQGGKDIPETMTQASAASCLAGGKVAITPRPRAEAPAIMPETVEAPKVGVLVTMCGQDTSVIDSKALVEYAEKIPHVVCAAVFDTSCGCAVTLESLKSTLMAKGCNRVVIAGSSPRYELGKYQALLGQMGINKYLIEVANIREQVAWVHGDQPQEANAKARQMLAVALANVIAAKPLADHVVATNKNALVVGGGVTGMTAALELADQGAQVYLVEKSTELGGVARNLVKTIEGGDVRALLAGLAEKTTKHPNIKVFTKTQVVDHSGQAGLFRTGLSVDGAYKEIEHGAAILATGATPNQPKAFLLGENSRVCNQLDLQKVVSERLQEVKKWNNVVMIQCVGSRDADNPNCSRLCCQSSIKNALAILKENPNVRIFVLYRDLRTYGRFEEYYQKARDLGVIFVRYKTDNPPQVEAAGNFVNVTYTDAIMGRQVVVSADCVGLSTGFVASRESNQALAKVFGLPLTEDGYFAEMHVKLRPVDMDKAGFFVAGTAHSPKVIFENLTQARAAASRALTVLANDTLVREANFAHVDRNRCAACLICVRVCPFDVPRITVDDQGLGCSCTDDKGLGRSYIDPAKCHGCGTCAAECPAKAIQLNQFEDAQILASLDQLLAKVNV